MGDALRRLFVSLGVALGLSVGQPDPALSARIFQEEGIVQVNARIDDAFAPGTRELVDSGSSVALRFAAELEAPGRPGRRAEETRYVFYDLRERRYMVSWGGGARTAALADSATARSLASMVSDMRLCPVDELASGGRITVSASIGILDGRGDWHEAPVLWNYARPSRSFAFGSPTEVPR